jgi:hypothetical protein
MTYNVSFRLGVGDEADEHLATVQAVADEITSWLTGLGAEVTLLRVIREETDDDLDNEDWIKRGALDIVDPTTGEMIPNDISLEDFAKVLNLTVEQAAQVPAWRLHGTGRRGRPIRKVSKEDAEKEEER